MTTLVCIVWVSNSLEASFLDSLSDLAYTAQLLHLHPALLLCIVPLSAFQIAVLLSAAVSRHPSEELLDIVHTQ
jgi:hypothetical protein